MTGITRQPVLRVLIDGGWVANCLGAHTSHILNIDTNAMDVATAQVDIVSPAPGALGDLIEIQIGASYDTLATRFLGFITDINRDLYPAATSMRCQGLLRQASVYYPPTTPDPDNYDLTGGGVGDSDEDYITAVLTLCGLNAVTTLDISGTGRTMGAGNQSGFAWNTKKTASSWIHRLEDVCLGYRTRDQPSGHIERSYVTMFPAGSPSVPIFTQGVDIYRASLSDTLTEATDRVVVTGNAGSYETGTRVGYRTKFLSSTMIERRLSSESGTGLSAEEVATWYLAENNRLRRRLVMTTYRDDLIQPGYTIDVATSSRLGLTSTTSLLVNQVDVTLSRKNQFLQNLVCIATVA